MALLAFANKGRVALQRVQATNETKLFTRKERAKQMDLKTVFYCLLIFLAYVLINFIFNIIQKLIEASITKKALQEKIDICYLKLIEKIKLLTTKKKEGNQNEM